MTLLVQSPFQAGPDCDYPPEALTQPDHTDPQLVHVAAAL
jgi:hypothetical protein